MSQGNRDYTIVVRCLLAVLVALATTLWLAAGPAPVSAQTTCNGHYYPTLTSCDGTLSCNSNCPAVAAGVTCAGTYYPNQAACPMIVSPLGVTCNGVFLPDLPGCPNDAGVSCNGTYYANDGSCAQVSSAYGVPEAGATS